MRYSGIGGQAVMEGVMMKNQDKYAVAVRKPDNEIIVDVQTYGDKGKLKGLRNVPFVRGVWPSFWTSSSGALGNTSTYNYSIEVDIFEVFSSLDKLSPNIHKWYGDGRHTMWAIDEGNSNEWYKFESDNLINEYHVYGFEWTPTKMVMYIDEKPYYTYDLTKNFDNGETGMGGFDAPLYLIFNNHLFTDSSSYKPYAGCEVHAPDLPAEYVIDWVRLYQKNDGKSELHLAK